MLTRLKNQPIRKAVCLPDSQFIRTQNNLALTPAKIKELTDAGIAVSAGSASVFTTDDKSGYDIDPLYIRGMDRNTLWERQQDVHSVLNTARDKKSVSKRKTQTSE